MALTIMALVFTSLFEVFSGGLQALSRSATRSTAVSIAESRLAELSLPGTIARGDDRGRVTAADGTAFTWRTHVEPHGLDAYGGDASSDYRLYRTRVEVEWGGGRGQRLVLDSLTAVPRR